MYRPRCWALIFSLLLALSGTELLAQTDTLSLRFEPLVTGLSDAISLDITPLPHLYVVEAGKSRFLKLDTDGTRIDSLGNLGFGEYQFDGPRDIDATNGLKIYVSDYENRRIAVYDRRMQFLTSITAPRNRSQYQIFNPGQLAVNQMDELFFYDANERTIIKFNIQGELDLSYSARVEQIGLPPADLETLDNDLLVADNRQQMIHRLSSGGQHITFWGGIEGIAAMSVLNEQVWVAGDGFVHHFGARGTRIALYSYQLNAPVRDLAVSESVIYLLTESVIWKADRPR